MRDRDSDTFGRRPGVRDVCGSHADQHVQGEKDSPKKGKSVDGTTGAAEHSARAQVWDHDDLSAS